MLHKTFSKQIVKVLAIVVEDDLYDQGFVQSLRIVHLSVLRSRFVAGVCYMTLKGYTKEGNFIRDILEL